MKITAGFSKVILAAASLQVALVLSASSGPAVRVAPMDSVGPRPVEPQTQSSVVRDYLLSWQTLANAMENNQPELLDSYFVGRARAKLADTIHDQQQLGIKTMYRDRSHDIRVVFYSPEGLSVQLEDDVEYDLEIRGSAGSLGAQHIHTRYIAVLTPTESQWKVRVFQGGAS